MKLVKPTIEYTESWREALLECEKEGTSGFWLHENELKNIEKYIAKTHMEEVGVNLPEGRVQATTRWLIDDGELIGHINIRHDLNVELEKRGGHIGYVVRPTARRKGYASEMLRLGLLKVREMGIEKVLLTCDDDNAASVKVIEKNCGTLEKKEKVNNVLLRYYWIDLP